MQKNVFENFRGEAVSATLKTEFSIEADIRLILPATETAEKTFNENRLHFSEIPPRTLVAVNY
jgi:hypothetical protein